MAQRLLDPGGDQVDGVDLLAAHVDAAEADQPILGQRAEHGHVPRHRDGVLQDVLIHPQAAQGRDEGLVAAGALPAQAPGVAAAEVHRHGDPGDPVHDLVEQVDGEVDLVLRVVVAGAHLGIDEEAEVGVVELGDAHPAGGDRLKLGAQHRDEGAHERLPGGVRLARALRVPHPLGEQVGRGQAHLGQPVRVGDEEGGLLGDAPRPAGGHRLDDHVEGARRAQLVVDDVRVEAVHHLGDDADVGAPAPLPVRDQVDAGRLLEGDHVLGGGVQPLAVDVRGHPALRPGIEQVAQELRAGHTADYPGDETRAGGRLHRFRGLLKGG